jgi:hypothetical protein
VVYEMLRLNNFPQLQYIPAFGPVTITIFSCVEVGTLAPNGKRIILPETSVKLFRICNQRHDVVLPHQLCIAFHPVASPYTSVYYYRLLTTIVLPLPHCSLYFQCHTRAGSDLRFRCAPQLEYGSLFKPTAAFTHFPLTSLLHSNTLIGIHSNIVPSCFTNNPECV